MSTDNQTQERRCIDRYDLRLLSLVRAPHEAALELYTRDVSSEGAFFFTDRPLPVDSRLQMTLFLPAKGFGPSKIATHGEVVRTDRDGIAVHFNPSYTISKA
jgi:hypothetical protein